jgi:carotene biosynthesis associated membrane protein
MKGHATPISDDSLGDTTAENRPARLALLVLVAAAGFSLAGTFFLRLFPQAMAVIGPFYPTLVKAPTWLFMGTLPILVLLMYRPVLGGSLTAWIALWACAAGAAAELIGTTTGFPFGSYEYTFWLGDKFLGHVPWLIPPSWFALGLVSYDLGARVARSAAARVALGALILTAWDVSLDPAMSKAFPFWTYPDGGQFYGMPLTNWAGWLLVSALIMGGVEWLVGGQSAKSPLAPRVYLVNCLFPIGLSLAYGLWGAVLAGLAATALVLWLVLPARRLQPKLARLRTTG